LVLERVGVASPPARIAALAQELLEVRVSASQFASFRKADERSYRRNPRNRTYILPALSAVDLSGMPGMVTLSSWPLERRVIGGYSQRVDSMQVILAAHAAVRNGEDPSATAVIRVISREFPLIARWAPDCEAMAAAAAEGLEDIAGRDAEERSAAAVRASRLDPPSRLFGRAPLSVVAER
jgi:hypothetical protein